MEWRVIEYRDEASWSASDADQPDAVSSQRVRPGLVNYLAAGVGLVLTGILAVFAFSFLVVVVLPLAAIGGGICWWRWRRMLQQAQNQARQSVKSPGGTSATRVRRADREDVIDI